MSQDLTPILRGVLTITDKYGNMVRLADVREVDIERTVFERVEPGHAKSITWQPHPQHYEVRWVNPTKRNKKVLITLESNDEPS